MVLVESCLIYLMERLSSSNSTIYSIVRGGGAHPSSIYSPIIPTFPLPPCLQKTRNATDGIHLSDTKQPDLSLSAMWHWGYCKLLILPSFIGFFTHPIFQDPPKNKHPNKQYSKGRKAVHPRTCNGHPEVSPGASPFLDLKSVRVGWVDTSRWEVISGGDLMVIFISWDRIPQKSP